MRWQPNLMASMAVFQVRARLSGTARPPQGHKSSACAAARRGGAWSIHDAVFCRSQDLAVCGPDLMAGASHAACTAACSTSPSRPRAAPWWSRATRCPVSTPACCAPARAATGCQFSFRVVPRALAVLFFDVQEAETPSSPPPARPEREAQAQFVPIVRQVPHIATLRPRPDLPADLEACAATHGSPGHRAHLLLGRQGYDEFVRSLEASAGSRSWVTCPTAHPAQARPGRLHHPARHLDLQRLHPGPRTRWSTAASPAWRPSRWASTCLARASRAPTVTRSHGPWPSHPPGRVAQAVPPALSRVGGARRPAVTRRPQGALETAGSAAAVCHANGPHQRPVFVGACTSMHKHVSQRLSQQRVPFSSRVSCRAQVSCAPSWRLAGGGVLAGGDARGTCRVVAARLQATPGLPAPGWGLRQSGGASWAGPP